VSRDDDNINNNIIKFFVYLYAELNSQWPITKSAQIQTIGQNKQANKETNKETNNNNNELYSDLHSANTEKDAFNLPIRVFVMCNAKMCDNKYSQESRCRIQLTYLPNMWSSASASLQHFLKVKTSIILL
jgi:hypothetical protein